MSPPPVWRFSKTSIVGFAVVFVFFCCLELSIIFSHCVPPILGSAQLTSSHPTQSHIISFHLFSSHLSSPPSFHLMSRHPTSPPLIPLHVTSSDVTSPHSHLMSGHLTSPPLILDISCHLTSSHLISLHLTSSHVTSLFTFMLPHLAVMPGLLAKHRRSRNNCVCVSTQFACCKRPATSWNSKIQAEHVEKQWKR